MLYIGVIIVALLIFILGIVCADYWVSKIVKKQLLSEKKFQMYYNIFNRWLFLRQNGFSIVEILLEKNFNNVIVYGMREFGERLLFDLEEAGIHVVCVIDQNKENICCEKKVISLDELIPKSDAIIVTPVWDYNQIENTLKKRVNCAIISLEYLLRHPRKLKQ